MPVWPKSFYTFGISLKTAATEWKLRQKRSSPGHQQRAFSALTTRLARAPFWRAAGITSGMSYEDFQARVPLHTYERLLPAIERMKQGEPDVLSRDRCALFAHSAGTATGEPKYLPLNESMLEHFRRATLDALLYYTVRVKNAGVCRGRYLLLGGSTALDRIANSGSHEAFAAGLSGVTAINLPRWVEKHLYEPGPSVAQISDWDARLKAVVSRASARDITLLSGLPNWSLVLAHALRERSAASNKPPVANLQTIWPNLECFMHTGVSIAPFAKELRAVLGPNVKFHEVYAASEAFIATQDSDTTPGLRLMADLGVFFEFLPMSEFDPARLDQLGGKAVPLSEAKADVDYAIILTTPSGLARYVLEDVVRFTSMVPPRLIVVGHTGLRLNVFGEQVMEKDVTDALVTVCHRNNWTLVNFHVAPLLSTSSLTGQNRGRHEWWIELRPGTVATPTGPQIALALDPELQRANPKYAALRNSGAIEPPVVRLVMPGVFEHWLRYQGRWGGQHKLPRCRSDRIIADSLAQLTNFARD